MKILRFIFPFLFKRNWYNGQWEISKLRLVLFLGVTGFLVLLVLLVVLLQAPIEYQV